MKETLESKISKFKNKKFIAGDMSDDIKDLMEEIVELKKRISKLEK